jgi:hypothetical protein
MQKKRLFRPILELLLVSTDHGLPRTAAPDGPSEPSASALMALGRGRPSARSRTGLAWKASPG